VLLAICANAPETPRRHNKQILRRILFTARPPKDVRRFIHDPFAWLAE
jgi:hypothetical protein